MHTTIMETAGEINGKQIRLKPAQKRKQRKITSELKAQRIKNNLNH